MASLTMQFLLYLIVGGLSFCVDIGVFVLLQLGPVPVIPASITSFIAAAGANYVLSTRLVFQAGRFRQLIEIGRFFGVVAVGLALNTAFVWCFVYLLGIRPTVAKIVAVPIVLVWNYVGRRLLVFHRQMPPISRRWVEPLSDLRRRHRSSRRYPRVKQPDSGQSPLLPRETLTGDRVSPTQGAAP
jgi:putative flippase GtrA